MIMLSSLQMWSIFFILSDDLFYFDDAMMETQSFKIYHFMVYSLVLYCEYWEMSGPFSSILCM